MTQYIPHTCTFVVIFIYLRKYLEIHNYSKSRSPLEPHRYRYISDDNMIWRVILPVLLGTNSVAIGYRAGAPRIDSVCLHRLPHHDVTSQTSESPYVIRTSVTKADGSYDVTGKSSSGYIRGLPERPRVFWQDFEHWNSLLPLENPSCQLWIRHWSIQKRVEAKCDPHFDIHLEYFDFPRGDSTVIGAVSLWKWQWCPTHCIHSEISMTNTRMKTCIYFWKQHNQLIGQCHTSIMSFRRKW